MIYLIQDCYKDEEGSYHDILKIGYSSRPFRDGRKSQYDSHNYGFKLLSEREGSQELEKYLHKRLTKYHLSLEWFKYDPEVIKIFGEVSENDLSYFKSQEELNEYIRYYILKNLIPSIRSLSSRYMKKLIKDLKLLYASSPEYYNLGVGFEEKSIEREIYRVFSLIVSAENDYIKNLKFESPDIISILSDNSLLVGLINSGKDLDSKIPSFYETIRKEDLLDRAEFDRLQEERKKSTEKLLTIFSKCTEEEQKEYIFKLKDSIKVSQYSRDFISISKHTNLPVYNTFIEVANERAWEVSQKDYQDKINVTKALESVSTDISEYYDEYEKITQDFLDNHFYQTGIFTEKMRMYCEFMDKYQGNREIEDIIFFKIRDERFRKYYNFYGTKGCSAKNYQEKYLYEGMIDVTKEEELQVAIYKFFQVGQRYTKKEIKSELDRIYRSLDITSISPKAIDLAKYFKLIRTKIQKPDDPKKYSEGFRLENL